MLRTLYFGLLLGAGLLSPRAARADLFAIDLEVKTPAGSKTAHAETAGPGEKTTPPTVLEARAGDRVAVRWTLRNADAKATVADLLVHFYAVKAEKVGQKSVAKLDKDVVAESALTMDFKPKDQAEGAQSFRIEKPGSYLLRLETIGAIEAADGKEYFAVVDVVVR